MTGAEFLIAAGIMSAATSAVGAVAAKQQADFQGDVARRNAEFQQLVANQNARLAISIGERNAQAALERSALQETMLRRDRLRRIASARAAYGSAGVTLEGTPLEVLANMAGVAEHEALLVRHAGAVEAREASLEAQLAARREHLFAAGAGYAGETAARAAEARGTGALIGGFGQAGATLLGTFDEAGFRGGWFEDDKP